MLQQTTTQTVVPYFLRFIARFPDMHALAESTLDDVLHVWQGLGYYRRAKHLHQAARMIVDQYKGCIPSSKAELLSLPGIGEYTANAILAIAFDQPVLPIDGNIRRILTRHGSEVSVEVRPGDICQALMDLANTVCLAKAQPLCATCPIHADCAAYRVGEYTVARKSVKKKIMYTTAHVIRRGSEIMLCKNQGGGLLGHLWNVPMDAFVAMLSEDAQAALSVRHVFTHIDLHVSIVVRDEAAVETWPDAQWVEIEALCDYPSSTLTKKILGKVL